MTYRDFIKRYNNRYANYDKRYPNQCTDLVQLYNRDVVGGKPFRGNGINYWTSYDPTKYKQIPNRWYTIPRAGDIAVFGTSVSPKYGHVDIVYTDKWNLPTIRTFSSFSQNWPLGSKSRVIRHPEYRGVIGFLRRK
jgi:hypothetical protein